PWDGVGHEEPLVYRPPHLYVEYRLKVDWFLDLRRAPITPDDLGFNPVQSVQRIVQRLDQVRDLVRERGAR
ncbi:MAG: hypothetical protein AAF211_32765, partial [Myxococcota bacterium]